MLMSKYWQHSSICHTNDIYYPIRSGIFADTVDSSRYSDIL